MSGPTMSDPETARRAILECADAAFYVRGITAVSMADIRDHSGVSMRRIYSLYPSKSDLVLAWLQDRHDQILERFVRVIEDGVARGADVVDVAFDDLAGWLAETQFRGCAFVNTLSEAGRIDQAHRRVIRDHKQALADALQPHHPSNVALALLLDGAIVQTSIYQSLEPLETARSIAHQLPR